MAEQYTDKCGHVIDRATALREATDTILSQGDASDIVWQHMDSLTDDELMQWLVYPDTGEFPPHLHRAAPDDREGSGGT